MGSSLWLALGWDRESLRECVGCHFVGRAVDVDRAIFDDEADEIMAYVDMLCTDAVVAVGCDGGLGSGAKTSSMKSVETRWFSDEFLYVRTPRDGSTVNNECIVEIVDNVPGMLRQHQCNPQILNFFPHKLTSKPSGG